MEPQTWKRLLVLVGLLILLFCLWQVKMTRYWYVAAGEGVMYRADRWTGEILYVEGYSASWVRIPEPLRAK